jgi:hypothetical protein
MDVFIEGSVQMRWLPVCILSFKGQPGSRPLPAPNRSSPIPRSNPTVFLSMPLFLHRAPHPPASSADRMSASVGLDTPPAGPVLPPSIPLGDISTVSLGLSNARSEALNAGAGAEWPFSAYLRLQRYGFRRRDPP